MSVLGPVEREMARFNRERSGAPEFVAWPKTPRLFRDMVITEKIDGTNACVVVTEDGRVYAQSRNRMLEAPSEANPKGTDNAGFRAWVDLHWDTLAGYLGEGHHYGEWWGLGIQRGYGLDHRRFSLFNTGRWNEIEVADWHVDGLGVVPVLAQHTFSTVAINQEIEYLRENGSSAAPGFMQPEGICVYLTSSRQTYKVLLENDELPKGMAA